MSEVLRDFPEVDWFALFLSLFVHSHMNPLTPKSDKHLTSPYHVSPK